jgi:hypothetical protein
MTDQSSSLGAPQGVVRTSAVYLASAELRQLMAGQPVDLGCLISEVIPVSTNADCIDAICASISCLAIRHICVI